MTERPNDADMANKYQRDAAYWREQADNLADALIDIDAFGKDKPGHGFSCHKKAATALAEYNASK